MLMKKGVKIKVENKNANFPTYFCLGSTSNRFSNTESIEIFLNRKVYYFSVDYNSIDKWDTLNINKYLMAKNI